MEDDNQRDSVFVNLSYDLGKEIFDMVDRESDTLNITNVDDDFTLSFQEDYLKGFAIKPATGSSAFIVGFNATADSAQSPRFGCH